MADCLVSVLCTAYNHEEYIRDALESIVSQQTVDIPLHTLKSYVQNPPKFAAIAQT